MSIVYFSHIKLPFWIFVYFWWEMASDRKSLVVSEINLLPHLAGLTLEKQIRIWIE